MGNSKDTHTSNTGIVTKICKFNAKLNARNIKTDICNAELIVRNIKTDIFTVEIILRHLNRYM